MISNQSKQPLIIVDGYSLFYRAYYAFPQNLTSPDGVVVNAVYGFLVILFNAIETFKPYQIIVCLDRKDSTFRHDMYDQYKKNRPEPDALFLIQIPLFKEVLSALSLSVIDAKGFEADDCIGTIAKYCSGHSICARILSSDMDLLQLVDEHVHVAANKRGSSDYMIYTPDAVKKKYNITPSQVIDFKALKGDTSDNIPGVKGVGDKTAAQLIKDFGTLESIYDNLGSIKSNSLYKKLSTAKDMAFLSKQLVTIHNAVPISFETVSKSWAPNWVEVIPLFERLNFKSLIKRLNANLIINDETKATETVPVVNSVVDASIHTKNSPQLFVETMVTVIDTVPQLNRLIPLLSHGFAFDLETTSLDRQSAEIVAISITASSGLSFVCNCVTDDSRLPNDLFQLDSTQRDVHPLLHALKHVFEDSSIPKIIHNAKYEIQVLHMYGIQINGPIYDTLIIAYCMDSRQKLGLKALAKSHFDIEMTTFEELNDGYDSIKDVPLSDLAKYAGADSNVTYQLYELFRSNMSDSLFNMYQSIEAPLINVLANMEINGVACDINFLSRLGRDYQKMVNSLETQIYTLAGGATFNINSTKQLGEVLFDQLKLPVIKKTKTGRSTDSNVLEKLSKDYDIARVIQKYRMYQKLLSTYILSLPELVHPISQRIHASFNQSVTATGRLSSNEPNLQNIPIRSKEGQNIRQSFISRFEKGKIVAIDYSQIELRVLAHLSKDPAMLAAFNNGDDIHCATAAKIFGVNYNNVSKTQREQAKTVNFGITYGQSAFALSDQLSISTAEAKQLIDQYYTEFSQIKVIMSDIVQFVRNYGYVDTLYGRIRYIDDINSPNRSIQSNAQRIAINTKMQGTAADIIKLAMISIQDVLTNKQSKLVIQVHDELVFDIHPDEFELIPLLKSCMEGIVELDIPLIVDVEWGDNWGHLLNYFDH